MDGLEAEEKLLVAGSWKLHGGICKQLSEVLYKVLDVFPVLEAVRPGSKSGIQALCSLYIALEKAKSLLQHCSECSKIYLAITGDTILIKFEKARSTLLESLHAVEEIVPQSVVCQVSEVVDVLEETVFSLDLSEKQIGDEVVQLLQAKTGSGVSVEEIELETFHRAVAKLGITSSRAALTERRALKKMIERARAEEDKKKESVVAYLLHLMRKYSKLFRSEVADESDSQGSAPCSPTVADSHEYVNGHLCKLGSLEIKHNELSGIMPIPPEELRCPISLQLMYDPVVISSGQTYERVCIEKWLNDGHRTCPKTKQHLRHLSLTPNYCVKGLITSWCEENGVPVPSGPAGSPNLDYWRLAMPESDATDSRPMESSESCQSNDLNKNVSCQDHETDEFERYKNWLLVLREGKYKEEQRKAVEQIRFLLKDDAEARIYMGSNGFAEALAEFLRTCVRERDTESQEAGAMALFNLAVNNNRNKEMLLSAGVMSLLEEMAKNSKTYEAATALYLNLSCLREAKPVIGSSQATPFLIQSLQDDGCRSSTCRLDALYTLYNLSTHAPNVPYLVNSGIVCGLHPLLTAGFTWADKALAIYMNLASDALAKNEMITTPGLIGTVTSILDTGEPTEQEQAASCLWVLCEGDDKCSHIVLQEGVIPALVLLSANGTSRGKDKAQKLLKLFRDQRQHELCQVQVRLHDVHQMDTPRPREFQQVEVSDVGGSPDGVPPGKLRSMKLGKALSFVWKHKHHHHRSMRSDARSGA